MPRAHACPRRSVRLGGGLAIALLVAAAPAGDADPPPTPGTKPPHIDDRTVVLFDGTAWTGWHQRDGKPSGWAVQRDGSVEIRGGDAITDLDFGDAQVHLEFLCPSMPDRAGQARANSGVYLHGRYEVQILDSYGLETLIDGCGAIYSVAPPLVNASRPPDHWQSYDIVFRAPRFDDAGQMTEPPQLTVFHNGIVVQSHQPVPHPTRAGIASDMVRRGPLMLQDHGNPIRYRNIWLRRLD